MQAVNADKPIQLTQRASGQARKNEPWNLQEAMERFQGVRPRYRVVCSMQLHSKCTEVMSAIQEHFTRLQQGKAHSADTLKKFEANMAFFGLNKDDTLNTVKKVYDEQVENIFLFTAKDKSDESLQEKAISCVRECESLLPELQRAAITLDETTVVSSDILLVWANDVLPELCEFLMNLPVIHCAQLIERIDTILLHIGDCADTILGTVKKASQNTKPGNGFVLDRAETLSQNWARLYGANFKKNQ